MTDGYDRLVNPWSLQVETGNGEPLDPDPWTTCGFRGLGKSQEPWDGPATFDPRPGFSQNRADYEHDRFDHCAGCQATYQARGIAEDAG